MFDNIPRYSLSTLRWALGALWWGFEAFANLMDRFLVIFGVAMLVGMWGLLFFNTIARWTDRFTIDWSLEIVGYMVAWSIFVMAGPVTRANEHINVTFLPEKLLGEKRGAAFIYVWENFVGLGLCIFLTLHAYRFVDHTYHLDWRESSVSGGWEYPMWIIRSGILVGFLFCSVYYFERTVRWIRSLFTDKGAIGEESSSEGTMDDAMKKYLVTQEREDSNPESETDAQA